MKKITLTRGNKIKEAKVDDIDYDWLTKFEWHFRISGGDAPYAVRYQKINKKTKTIYMHREINKTEKGFVTDHVNGDTLDNRRKNLRTVNAQQNGQNSKISKNNTTGYKGVCFNKNKNKYQANICFDYKNIYLGLFCTAKEAAKAYNDKAIELFGEYASINKIS